MRARATAGVLLAALALSACSGGGSSSSSHATATTSAAPESVPAGTLNTPGLAAGQTWTSQVGDAVTYYASAAPAGKRTAIDVGFCAAAAGGAAGVSSFSWVLIGSDGRIVRPAAPSAAPSPAYPDTKLVVGGSCLRGWVAFDVPAGVQIARVGYQPEGSTAPLATWTP